MRILLFVLTFVMATGTIAAQPLRGTLLKSGQDLFLQSNDACGKYRIDSKNDDVTNILIKLAPGDSVNATGDFDTDKCVAAIESIDYVGLKRFLGNWISKEGLITVHDFSTLSLYPAVPSPINNDPAAKSSNFSVFKPQEYKYSVTPSDGKEWVLFLSDTQSTTFATIQFAKEAAVVKIYDSENGNVNKVLILSRAGTLK
ncbi:MAG TPA: hypothetical protein VN132_14875 [Bdellovibrio sp.]|nr:hypothetical protein [Bdellovibrio sp.]